jgi:hypothetical protein
MFRHMPDHQQSTLKHQLLKTYFAMQMVFGSVKNLKASFAAFTADAALFHTAEGVALRMSQHRRGWFDAGLVCRSQGQIERDLNFAGRFFASIAKRRDRRPFNDLSDIAFVARFR